MTNIFFKRPYCTETTVFACTLLDYYSHLQDFISLKKILLNWWDAKFCFILPMMHCASFCSAAQPGEIGASEHHLSQAWATTNQGGSGVEESMDRENPWSGLGLLSLWSWVLAHISWLLPGCLLSAISRPYHLKQLWVTCGRRSTLSLLQNKEK